MTQRVRAAMALALVVGLTAAACSSNDENPPSAGSDLNGKPVTFVSFGGNLQKAEEKAFTAPFAQRTGAKVTTDSPSDYAKVKAQVESGNVTWDVMHADPFFIVANCGTLFEKLDTAVVVNQSQIDSSLRSSECDLPHMRYGIVLYYNAKKFGSSPPQTWADFFDTTKFPGKRGAWGYAQNGMIEAALLADGVAPQSLYPLDLDRAFAKLNTIKSSMSWTQGPGQVAEQVVSGSVDMALIYTGRAYDAATQAADWKVSWDAPSIVSWESVAVVKGTPRKDAAMALVNHFGDKAAQEAFAVEIAYSPTNTAAKPNLNDVQKEYAVSEHTQNKTVALDQKWWADNFDAANQRWTAWQAG